MHYLIIVLFFHFFFGQLIELTKSRVLAYIFSLLVLFFTFYFTLGIRETADTFMYEYFYYNDWDKIDPMFIWISKLGKYLGWNYDQFYQFHIVINTLAFLFFITRFTRNHFYIFLLFITLYFVPFINQIRYYMALPFYLISLYYIVINRNILYFILFSFLSLTSHFAILILYAFLPIFYFISDEKFYIYIFTFTGVFFIFIFLLFQFNILQQIEHFGAYFSKGFVSSFSGGLYNAIPYFIYLGFIYYWDSWYRKKYPNLLNDTKYIFLRKLSFFTIIFIPGSIISQVLGHRYVFPFIIIWAIFFLLLIKKQNPQHKFKSFFIFFIVNLVVGFIFFDLESILLGESHFENELIRSLKTVDYLDYFF